MAYRNKHLIEVVCGFQFAQEPSSWDSTYFGQFYEKIKILGFTEKQERKGFQIEINAGPFDVRSSVSTNQEASDVVIFKDLGRGWAITMGRNKVSFHVIKDYTRWEDFRDNFITPFHNIYKEIGLGNGPRQCNVLYLNRISKPVGEELADYFTIISALQGKFGIESGSYVQRTFNKGTNLLITKLNTQAIPGSATININLECGSVCTDDRLMITGDWIQQANETHAPILGFFEAIITNKLRQEL